MRTGLAKPTDADLPSDYTIMRQDLSSDWVGKTGVTYEPLLSDTENPYYTVYVELTGHSNSNDVPYNIEIVGDDGTYSALLPKLGESETTGWHRERIEVGKIKLSDPRFNTISLTLPIGTTYYNQAAQKPADYNAAWIAGDYLGMGGIKLVQCEGTPEELLPLERSSFVMEPVEDMYGLGWNPYSTVVTNAYYASSSEMLANLDDIYDLDLTHNRTQRSYGTNYSTKTGNRKAQIYKGLWTNSESQAGWYKIYIDKIAHTNTEPVPYLTVSVVHAGGTSEYIMDRNFPATKTTWNASRHYVGTFKMNYGGSHQIRLYGPVLADGAATGKRVDLGAILCVPVTEEEAIAAKTAELTAESDLYLKPVYSADFKADFEDDGENENAMVEYYKNGGYHQLYLDASEGKTSIKTVAYDKASDDLKKALEFDEGILDFDLYWTYNAGAEALTAAKAPYFSVILGKSATQSAEIRIYMDKAQLIEKGLDSENNEITTTTDLLIPTDYYYYLVTAAQQGRTLKTTGWKPNCRIEITDVANDNLKNGLEATSRSKSKDGANGATKLLKVYLFGLTGSEVCIGANYIPADSVLYDEDEVLTDNYIEFVNYPGETIDTELQNLLKVRNLSVAEPDTSITKGDLVEEVVTEFTDAGAYKMNAYIPFKHSNKLGESNVSKEYAYAIGAYKGDALVDVDAYEKKIGSGDKTTIDLSVDVSKAEKVKLFQWNNFDKMVPYVSAVQK